MRLSELRFTDVNKQAPCYLKWWRRHTWLGVSGLVEIFSILSQCQNCNMVKVDNALLDYHYLVEPYDLRKVDE